MKRYVGTKLVQAEPAVRFEGKVYTKNDLLPVEAITCGKVEHGYRVVYPDGYVSWSPKEVFEEAYRPTNGMNFGLAVEAMKKGKRVARWGWNGRGMYVFLADEVEFHTNADISEFAIGESGIHVADVLVMRTAQATLQPGWLASQADMLADDWYIVE